MSYCEWPVFYGESFPKARKAHHCCECSAPIEVGEKHLYWRGKWDGDFSAGRQHMLCREVCMFLNKDNSDCFAFGDLWEYWRDHGYADKDWIKRCTNPAYLAELPRARGMIAAIKWRERKHRTRRRQLGGQKFMKKKWGQPWQVVP